MSKGRDIELDCLHEMENGEQCGATLTVHLTWSPAEWEYGYCRFPAGWEAGYEISCEHHPLTEEEKHDIEERAIDKACELLDDYDPDERD